VGKKELLPRSFKETSAGITIKLRKGIMGGPIKKKASRITAWGEKKRAKQNPVPFSASNLKWKIAKKKERKQKNEGSGREGC